MAPKKAPAAKAAAGKEEKPKKPEMSPELKALKEKEKAVEKVDQPNREAHDASLTKVQADIDVLQDKMKKIQNQINEKSQGKEEHFKMKEEIREKLNEYSAKIDELDKAKQREIGGMQEAKNKDRERRQELNTMKKKLGYDDIKEIDAKIREIEFQMQTESLSLKKEKELMIRIKDLKASRPLVTKYAQMEANQGPVDTSTARMSIDEIKKQIDELKEAKKLQQAAYSKLMEARQKVMGDVPQLVEKREELRAQINTKYSERSELKDEFRKQEQAFKAYLNEVRQIRNERYAIERTERQKEYESRSKEAAPSAADEAALVSALPFFGEILYLENLTTYLKGLKPKEEEKKQEAATLDVKAGAGEVVLLAKGNREEEFFFAPTKKKNLKQKGAGKPKAFKHDMTTLGFFSQFKITPPTDSSQLDKAIEDVAAKIVEFKEKQVKKIEDDKKKKEKKEEGGDEAAPAEEAAAEA